MSGRRTPVADDPVAARLTASLDRLLRARLRMLTRQLARELLERARSCDRSDLRERLRAAAQEAMLLGRLGDDRDLRVLLQRIAVAGDLLTALGCSPVPWVDLDPTEPLPSDALWSDFTKITAR